MFVLLFSVVSFLSFPPDNCRPAKVQILRKKKREENWRLRVPPNYPIPIEINFTQSVFDFHSVFDDESIEWLIYCNRRYASSRNWGYVDKLCRPCNTRAFEIRDVVKTSTRWFLRTFLSNYLSIYEAIHLNVWIK